MRCGLSTFVSVRKGETHLHRFRCHSWKCRTCFPGRAKRLRKDAYDGRPTKFLTLTVDPAQFPDKHKAAHALVVAWRRMREAIQKSKGLRPIPFIAVFEAHKSGWPHLHILCRMPFVPQTWISDYMGRRLNSPICWIQALKSRKKAAGYVSKYIGKAPEQFIGCKRYWRNRAYIVRFKPPKDPTKTWTLTETSMEEIAEIMGAIQRFSELWGVEYFVIPTTGPPGQPWAA